MNLPEHLNIRDYTTDDYGQVIRLWSDTGMGGTQRGDNKWVIDRTLQNGGKLIILEENTTGKVIGTSWLTNDHRRLYLHHFGILPEYQGKGYSHLLAEASVAYAEFTGLQIKLEVHSENIKAISLYEKHGFKYLGDYLVYIIRDIKQ
ncbi:MAG: GNAT family N-acetyltransferase [Bacteroidota bacterium]